MAGYVRSWRDTLVAQRNTWRSAQVRAETRRARAAISAPGLPSHRRVRGSVWGVTMLKDEIDIVDPVLRHLVAQGVDRILVADNGSTDGTLERLHELARELPLVVVQDTDPAYFQAAKMNRLGRIAGRAGADWVVPFDADEFWFAPGAPLAEWLRSSGLDVVDARIHNAFPLTGTDHEPLTERELRLDLTAHHLPDVAYRAHVLASLEMGNHFISRPGRRGSGPVVVHVPWRSLEQLAGKVRGGSAALAEDPDQDHGSHWRTLGRLDDAELAGIWERLLGGEGDERLAWSPKGPFRIERPLQRTTWDG